MNLLSRLQSLANAPFYYFRKKARLTKHKYYEEPIGQLDDLDPDEIQSIQILKQKYQVCFEKEFNSDNAKANYFMLYLMDQAGQKIGFAPPAGQVIADVGSRNFYYAAMMQAFFKPQQLTGIELDAYRLYHNFHTRASCAHFYIRDLPNTDFLVQNFLDFKQRVDGLTLFYPFVIHDPLIAAGLPLTEFRPQDLFDHAYEILNPVGWIFMTNQGEEEFMAASQMAQKAGFKAQGHFCYQGSFLGHNNEIYISAWQKNSLD